MMYKFILTNIHPYVSMKIIWLIIVYPDNEDPDQLACMSSIYPAALRMAKITEFWPFCVHLG